MIDLTIKKRQQSYYSVLICLYTFATSWFGFDGGAKPWSANDTNLSGATQMDSGIEHTEAAMSQLTFYYISQPKPKFKCTKNMQSNMIRKK